MSVRAGALELPVRWAPDGPWLFAEGEAAPLALVVTAWLRRNLGEDLQALRNGDEVDDDGHYARRPGALDDLEAERGRWHRLAATDPGDDVYLLGLTYEIGELLVPRDTLIAIVEELVALRARPLEQQAQELDELAITASTPEDAARVHIRRKALLSLLAENGVLEGAAAAWVPSERLLGYALAAGELQRYASSEARRALAATLPPAPAVSIDWFRLHTPHPPGSDPFEWLARWEAIFVSGGPYAGPEGFTLVREDGRWYRLEWRRDDGETPVLLRVEPFEP